MKRILLIVAIKEEFKTISKLLKNRKDIPDERYKRVQGVIDRYPVEILMTSLGTKAAQQACEDIMNSDEHSGVLCLGYCGGLSLTLKNGDTVVASEVVSEDLKTKFALDTELSEQLGRVCVCEGIKYKAVPMVTQSRVIETPAEKESLYKKSFAEAVDMESFEIVKAAFKKHIKSAVVKVVIDDAQTQLPNYNDYIEKKGKISHFNMAPVFVSQPALMLQISKCMKFANGIFEKTVPSIISVVGSRWQQ